MCPARCQGVERPQIQLDSGVSPRHETEPRASYQSALLESPLKCPGRSVSGCNCSTSIFEALPSFQNNILMERVLFFLKGT